MTPLRHIGEDARAVTVLERIVRIASPDLTVPEIAARAGASEGYTRLTLRRCDLPYLRRVSLGGWTAADDRWPAETMARLSDLWDAGASVTAIGRAIGRSRSAVAGKARRMGLPGREAPVEIVRYRARLAAGGGAG